MGLHFPQNRAKDTWMAEVGLLGEKSVWKQLMSPSAQHQPNGFDLYHKYLPGLGTSLDTKNKDVHKQSLPSRSLTLAS